MNRLACLALIAVALGAVACGGTSDPSMDEPASSDDALAKKSDVVDVGEADNGKTVVVEQGKDIRLTLSETASTGYRWGVVSTDRSFGYPTPTEGTPIAATGPVGAKGKRQFVWKTDSPFLTPGDEVHEVKLENRRNFDDLSGTAANTFYLMVQIKAKGATTAGDTSTLPTLYVGKVDEGKTIDAQVGQKVTVRLPENPTTGYTWHVESVDRDLGAPDASYQPDDNDSDRVGGASGDGTFTWKLFKPAIGSHAVTFKKSRGAEGTAADHFKFVLRVAP